MNLIQQAAVRKKSFELHYHGGTIWCEHLDGMREYENDVISKFTEDKTTFLRSSVSSYMIINLDKTHITDQIAETIVTTMLESNKQFRKIAFVGVKLHCRKRFNMIMQKGICIDFFNDYEKAKEWIML